MPTVVAYDKDKDKAIEALKNTFDITEEDLDEYDIAEDKTLDDKKYEMAVELFDYNVIGGYVGEYTPIFITINT